MRYPAEIPDEKLIQFYLSNTPAALSTLSDLYKDRIYNAVYNIVQDKYVAEEIFGEVFVTIINQLMTGKSAEDGHFIEWATTIARQLAIEYNREKATLITATNSIRNTIPAVAASNPALFYESHDKLRSMINMLPDAQREVIALNHYAGLSFREIATRLKCSVTAALDTMRAGLSNLRVLMTEKEIVIR